MAKRKPPPPKDAPAPRPPSGNTPGVVAAKAVVALALVVGLIAGLGWLGNEAAKSVADRDRYSVPLADVQCDAPPGLDRMGFLTEVRYVGNLPERLPSMDPKLPDWLKAAFAKHPWVADVPEVTVSPERVIRVSLTFRKPVLAVTMKGELTPRAVDADGILLPSTAKTAGLPVLATVQPAAEGAGKPFPTPDVKRAAGIATAYPTKSIERTKAGWKLTLTTGATREIVSE